MTPDFVGVIDHFISPGIALLAFLLGKATKGGANQTLLDQNTLKVKQLEETQTQHSTMLASHTTLHAGYAETSRRVEATLQENNRMLGELLGRFDARR